MEVSETATEIVVTAEVPGLDESALSLTVAKDQLVLRGGSTQTESNKGPESTIRQQSFTRTVLLPCAVDMEKSNASLKNGILTVTLPRIAGSDESTRKIAIRRE